MLARIPVEGNAVQDSYIGNTHILIFDAAYAGNTPEEDRHVLERAAQASRNIILHNQPGTHETDRSEET